MSTQQITFFVDVFYKIDNRPGWKIARIKSNRDSINIKEKCKEYAERFNWYDYRVFPGGSIVEQLEEISEPNLEHWRVHQTSEWIYMPEIDRWFLGPDEEIPFPDFDCEVTNELAVSACFFDWYNEPEYLLDNSSGVYPEVSFIFETKKQKYDVQIALHSNKEILDKFINKVRNEQYACYVHIETSYCKFFAWPRDKKVRFLIQDYYNEKVVKSFDVLVDRKKFIQQFEGAVAYTYAENMKILADPYNYPFRPLPDNN